MTTLSVHGPTPTRLRRRARLWAAVTAVAAVLVSAVTAAAPASAIEPTSIYLSLTYSVGSSGSRIYSATDGFRLVIHKDSLSGPVVQSHDSYDGVYSEFSTPTLPTGDYVVTLEPLGTTVLSNYTKLVLSCEDFFNIVTDADWVESTPRPLDPAVGKKITVSTGSSSRCQFGVVPLRPAVTVKAALGGARVHDSDQFTVGLSETGSPLGTSTSSGTGASITSGTGSAFIGGTTLEPTKPYLVTSAPTSGASLADYTSTIACTDSLGVQPAGTGGLTTSPVAFDPAVGHEVVPAPGAKITCTVTYTPKPGEISIVQSVSSSTKNADGSYTVDYDVAVTNAGQRAETYSVAQALRPGAGASVSSGSWSGATSGSIPADASSVALASSRSLEPGAQESFAVSVVYRITPGQITGSGSTATNACRPVGSDVSGSWGFHAVATVTWNGAPQSAESCEPFPMSFTASVRLDGDRRSAGDQFTVEVRPAGQAAGPTSSTSGSGAVVDPGTGMATLSPSEGGKTYSVRLAGAGTADLNDYALLISCVDVNGVLPAGVGGITGTVSQPLAIPFDASTGYAVTPTASAQVECTVIVRPLAIGVSASVAVESVAHSGADYAIVYRVTVTNTGERAEVYSLSSELRPGAGAVLQEAEWSGPVTGSSTVQTADSGTIDRIDSAAVVAASRTIAAGGVDRYAVTVKYRIDSTKAAGGSNVCPSGATTATNYGLRSLASLTWRGTTSTSDACAGFEIPKPAVLGQTGAAPLWWILAPALALMAAGIVLVSRRLRTRHQD